MLTAFFERNRIDVTARQNLYKDFLANFTWDLKTRSWNTRRLGSMIGRLVSANPAEGECYYLRLLLTHISGPTCFEDLYTVNGILYLTFRRAAFERRLIESDDNLDACLRDASLFQFPCALRRLFVTILIYCELGDVRKLWDTHYKSLSEDYKRRCQSDERVQNMVLNDIFISLQSQGKHLDDFDLPKLNTSVNLEYGGFHEVQEEYSITVEDEHLRARNSLNHDQKAAFDEIIRHVDEDHPGMFFIDGPGGTGKTYLYEDLLAEIHSRGFIALATGFFR